MSRSKLLDHWERDLPGLSVPQLRDRLRLAAELEASSLRPGMGRNPKAGREWRRRRQQVEAELARRGSDVDGL